MSSKQKNLGITTKQKN